MFPTRTGLFLYFLIFGLVVFSEVCFVSSSCFLRRYLLRLEERLSVHSVLFAVLACVRKDDSFQPEGTLSESES